MPEHIQERIRKYRMGYLTIHVVDKNGDPVNNAHVKLDMTRHAFLFGCNSFQLKPDDTSPEQLAYQSKFKALFNYTTLGFYWGSFEQQQGQPDYATQDARRDWCLANGIECKVHPLVWHMVYPWWAPKDIDTAMPLIKQRVYDIVNREKGKVGYFDAVNEATSAAAYQQPNAVSEWIERDGAAKVIETVLGWARDADAGAGSMFTYNDFDIGESNVSLITQMQKDGVMPDVIGIQSHMHSGTWPMTELWSVAEKFGSFGKPVHFTETTILSGPNHSHNMDAPDETDWLTTDEGEQTQAAYVAQFYSVLFSHPALRAITWWDFTDKNCWMGAPGGLLRKDMSGKPAYDVLLKLIRHDWWTNASGSTSTDGLWTQHAFYGDYNVTVTDEHGHSTETAISYPEASGPRTVTVRL